MWCVRGIAFVADVRRRFWRTAVREHFVVPIGGRDRSKKGPRSVRCGVAYAESAAWKSRVLPADDDRQEEASGRTSGALGERTAANPTRWWYIPSFPADGRWRPVPWAKRCNRLPLLESGANLSALSSARSSANLTLPSCPRPRWSIDLKIDPINDRSSGSVTQESGAKI